jgi:hypothetical protein
MPRVVYRITFESDVQIAEVERLLVQAASIVESLYGIALARLEAAHALDVAARVVVMDGSTDVGRDFCKVFTGFALREFGPDSFCVRRAARRSQKDAAASVAAQYHDEERGI